MSIKFNVNTKRNQIPTKPANHGRTWTDQHKKDLKTLIMGGLPLFEICLSLGRTPEGVLPKAVKIGLIYQSNDNGNYYLADNIAEIDPCRHLFLDNHPSLDVTQKEVNIMSHHTNSAAPVIESKTLIQGVDASTMSDVEIFNLIKKLESKRDDWKSIQAKSKKLDALIIKMDEDILALVTFVDERV